MKWNINLEELIFKQIDKINEIKFAMNLNTQKKNRINI